MKNFTERKIIIRGLTALLTVVFFSAILSGCFLSENYLGRLLFNVDTISMKVGDEFDLYDYLLIEPDSSSIDLTAMTSDNNVATANYALRLKALSVGKTQVKVVAGNREAICNVEVSYRKMDSIKVFSQGELFQESDNISAVDFVAEVTEYVNPAYTIKWYVDDVEQSITGKYFSFAPTPSVIETYEVSAKVDGTQVSDSVKIMVYESIDEIAPISYTQSTNNHRFSSQTEGFWQYYIDGELTYSGFDNEWTYIADKPGIYDITAKLYGRPVEFSSGALQKTLIVQGAITPTNLVFDFDNCYPNTYISWDLPNVSNDTGFVYYVKITNADGTSTSFSSTTHASRFKGRTFSTASIVDITKEHTIAVSCEKQGEFSKSQYATINTQAISSSALPFLNKKYLDKNYYITSDIEYFEIYEYTLWMRAELSSAKNSIFSSLTVYMGYDSEDHAKKLTRLAWSRSGQSGLYYLGSPMGEALNGQVMSVKITFASDNAPSQTTNTTSFSSPILIPDVSFAGITDRKLYIENLTPLELQVSTSNELFYIIEKGFLPTIQVGSKAYEMFDYAKKVLKRIITDDMTELEKIHAIYDWILWRTHYDKDVLSVTELEESVKYEAYYLESVLNDDYPLAVCDGLSKTFSLLANMEGIKCVRVVGKADGGNNTWGEHAWNKVFYQGSWYLVDCTWGDYEINLSGKNYESASHQYLMLSKGQLSVTHQENGLGNYPEATLEPFAFFRNGVTRNDETINLQIFGEFNLEQRISEIVDFVLASRPSKSTYTLGTGRFSTKTVEYFGVDMMVPTYMATQVQNALAQEFQAKDCFSYVLTTVDEYMFVLVRY